METSKTKELLKNIYQIECEGTNSDNLAAFRSYYKSNFLGNKTKGVLSFTFAYRHSIAAQKDSKGTFSIEPKSLEPAKHRYNYAAETVISF